MPLRTKEQLILAANNSIDITSLVTTYLVKLEKAVRLSYKGYKNPVLVKSPFVVNIIKVEEDALTVGLTGTQTITCETPTYYGPDDDGFTEGYGVSNISGYTGHVHQEPVDQVLIIPMGCLLRTEQQMWEDVNKIVYKWTEEDKAKAREEEIARLEKKLAAVRAS